MPSIGNREQYVCSGEHGWALGCFRFVDRNVLGPDHQRPAIGHRIACIYSKIQDDLFDLSRVRFHRGEIGIRQKRIFDVLTNQTGEHFAHLGDDGVQLKNARLQHLHAAERQQLTGHGNCAVRSFLNLLQASLPKIIHPFLIDEQIAVASDHREQIVEVVRHAARESAYGLHLVRLAESLFELLLLLLRAFQAGTHPKEGIRDLRDFVSAAAFQRIIEIALLQGTNTGDQTGERPCERVRDQEDKSAACQNAKQAQADQDLV